MTVEQLMNVLSKADPKAEVWTGDDYQVTGATWDMINGTVTLS